VGLRLLFRKVGRFVFFLGANGGVSPNVEQGRNGAFVFAVGEFPQNARDGVLVISEGQAAGSDSTGAVLPVRVVQIGRAHTHGDVGVPALCGGIGKQASVGPDENDELLVVDGVAEVVGRLLGFTKFRSGASKLGLHGFEYGIGGGGSRC
jgi:hypothetical protein